MRRFIIILLLLFPLHAHATVDNENTYNIYTGNGSNTAFPYTFRILSTSEIKVFKNNVLQPSTSYVVSGVGAQGGGTVTIKPAPATGVSVLLTRNTPYTQTVDYIPNSLNADTIERSFDKLTILTQQLNLGLVHSFHSPPDSTYSTVFPAPGAGQCIKWNSSGTALEASSCASVSIPGSGLAGRAAFWISDVLTSSDPDFRWDSTKKELSVGTPGSSTVLPNHRRGIKVYVSAESTTSGYTGVVAQVQAPDSGNIELDQVGSGSDRIAISGYTVALSSDATANAHIGGDFGIILVAPDLCGAGCVKNYAVGVNVYTEVENLDPIAHSALGIAIRLGGGPAGANGSHAIYIEDNIVPSGIRWYTGLQFGSNSIMGSASGGLGGIFFNSSQPDMFINMRPSDDVDGVAVLISTANASQNNLQLMKSGRVLARQSLGGCSTPQFSFVDEPLSGFCSVSAGLMQVAINSTVQLTVSSTTVTLKSLEGSGTRYVCVSSTGVLTASATPCV